MYAVIKTGGKQYRVAAGDVIEVEHLRGKSSDATLTLTPLLVVTDDGKTLHGTEALAGYEVGAKVVGETKGDKIKVFKYRNKTGYARKTGHRQQYSMIEITSIGAGKGKSAAGAKATARKPPAKGKAGEPKAAEPKAKAKSSEAGEGSGTKAAEKPAKKATDKPAKKAAAPKAAETQTGSSPEGSGSETGNVSSDGS